MAVISEIAETLSNISNVSKFFILSMLLWSCWRLYRFTILPVLYPSRPKEYPYLIPYFGHVFAYFQNSNKLLDSAGEYFGDTKDPFALHLCTETLYIVTSPQSAMSLYKNTSTVTLQAFVKKMYTDIGLSEESIINMWTSPVKYERDAQASKQPQAMLHFYHQQQLSRAGEHHQLVTDKLMHNITKPLEYPVLQNHSALIQDEGDGLQVSLWKLCCQVFINGLSDAYTGECLPKISPNMVQASLDWEDTNWKFIYSLPSFLSNDLIAAKTKLENIFTMYFDTPAEQRSDAAYFVHSLERELRGAGLSTREVARIYLLSHWALVGNLYKQAFWVISQVLYNPELLAQIKQEIYKHSKNGLDIPALLDDCPRLDSVHNETLRILSAGGLLREVTAPTTIGSKVLTEGQKVVVPWCQLHLNESVWGTSPKKFDSERFLKDKSLAHNPSFRPFGSGATLCPGRFIARQTIVTFIATLILKFDMSLAATTPPQTFPKIDETKPGLGVMAPVHGSDLIVVLKRPTFPSEKQG